MGERTKQRAPAADDTPAGRLCLLVRGNTGAQVVPLARGARVVIGRGAPSDVVIDDETLSRRHAAFTWTDEGVWVEDLGSLNGTMVGDRAITRSLLVPGSEAVLGHVVASVHEDVPRGGGLPIVEEDGFEAWLEQAVAEAHERREPLALMMIRSSDLKREPMHAFVAAVRGQLAGWDHLGVYGPGWLVAAKRAFGFAGAEPIAAALAARLSGPPPLVGVAVFPASAASAEALIEQARLLARSANSGKPVVTARGPRQQDGDPVMVSAGMRAVLEAATKAARSRAPILLLGETGTGKDVLARAIVARSPRASGPFKTVNCAAIPHNLVESTLFGVLRGAFTGADRTTAGVFEDADGGTVFLDEIGELPPGAQAALLRVLETGNVARVGATDERAVDVRLIAATNRDLEALAKTGAFRADLLYRINTVTLRVPPLRDRPEDVLPLAQSFLDRAAAVEGRPAVRIDDEVAGLLQRHGWPGNVRELRNVVERMAILADDDVLHVEDLPSVVRLASTSPSASTTPAPTVSDLREHLRDYEANLIVSTLRACGWNQTEAARRLNLPIRTLTHKIATLGLKTRFPRHE